MTNDPSYSHLKEHLKDQIDTNKQMTPEEMEFHYFRYNIKLIRIILFIPDVWLKNRRESDMKLNSLILFCMYMKLYEIVWRKDGEF